MAGLDLVKVALLSDCYPPRTGGIESQVSDLARQLRAAGHEVEVFTATPGPEGQRDGAIEDDHGIPVHRMAIRLPGDLPVNPLAPPEVRRRLLDGGFDVAHVHMGVVSPFAWDMARVTTGIQLPTALTWHCVLDRMTVPMRATGAVQRWVDRGAVASAVSGFAAEGVRAVLGAEAPVAVLPNGIDPTVWVPPAGEDAPGPHRPIRMISAMRFAARKRPGALVHIIERALAQLGPGALTLEIVGDGPLHSRVSHEVERLGLADVISLPGRVSRAELAERYHRADVYVSPTRLEAFGIAVLEARTAGLAVVGRADSGVRDVITDGVSGLLVDSDEAFVEAVVRIVRDDALRTSIIEHNRSVPPDQVWSRVVDQAETEYARAIQKMSR